eukprot:CAMPEP_0197029028 /NCGR_PEP_ID=MMETSP1384-20130603/8575_1 /TAXON_ID=29189 /ORGANISM="Ammonia sp." /LENGTH=146 /DNA_ID=CAMNT_0042458127 /DNA_START=39 /DNA_END=479 /DNA_ORIENTATION=-
MAAANGTEPLWSTTPEAIYEHTSFAPTHWIDPSRPKYPQERLNAGYVILIAIAFLLLMAALKLFLPDDLWKSKDDDDPQRPPRTRIPKELAFDIDLEAQRLDIEDQTNHEYLIQDEPAIIKQFHGVEFSVTSQDESETTDTELRPL